MSHVTGNIRLRQKLGCCELYFVALQLDKKFGIICSPTIDLVVLANTVPLLASVT